jgi:hypothetical protein
VLVSLHLEGLGVRDRSALQVGAGGAGMQNGDVGAGERTLLVHRQPVHGPVVEVTGRVTDDAIGKRPHTTRGVLDQSIEIWIGPHARVDRANRLRRSRRSASRWLGRP